VSYWPLWWRRKYGPRRGSNLGVVPPLFRPVNNNGQCLATVMTACRWRPRSNSARALARNPVAVRHAPRRSASLFTRRLAHNILPSASSSLGGGTGKSFFIRPIPRPCCLAANRRMRRSEVHNQCRGGLRARPKKTRRRNVRPSETIHQRSEGRLQGQDATAFALPSNSPAYHRGFRSPSRAR